MFNSLSEWIEFLDNPNNWMIDQKKEEPKEEKKIREPRYETPATAASRIHFMKFGEALEYCKKGRPIARLGWNGKGMALAYRKGYEEGAPANKSMAKDWGVKEGSIVRIKPYFQLRGVDGTYQTWVVSHEDLLAEDWYLTR